MLLHTGKPHGLRTARKLRNHRRDQKWHDKDYKKSHLGTRWKSNPFGGASHAKGIVLEKVYVANADFFCDLCAECRSHLSTQPLYQKSSGVVCWLTG